MNFTLKNILLVLFALIFLTTGKSNGQGVTIPDPAFRQYLLDNHPTVMDSISQKLDTTANLFSYQAPINCPGRGIKNLEGIQYFKGVMFIDCSHNELTEIPSLVRLNNLQIFNCSHNQLDSVPALSPALTNLMEFRCNDNNLTSFPNLSGTGVDTIHCENNYLDFADLHFIKNTIGGRPFIYAPQKPVRVNPRIVLNEGDIYMLVLPIAIDTIVYHYDLYRNGIFARSPLSNADTITVNSQTIGFYHWEVRDTIFPNLILKSTTEEVAMNNKHEEVFTPDGDGLNDSYYIHFDGTTRIYNKSGELVKTIPAPGYWDGTDLQGRRLPVGAYILRCGDLEKDITLVY